MVLKIDTEFKSICAQIISENKSEEEWIDFESDDMFQTKSFCGGFDSLEMAFTFSYYNDGNEFWFQLTLSEMIGVADGSIKIMEMRLAE